MTDGDLVPLMFIAFGLLVALAGHWIAKRAKPEFWQEPQEGSVGISMADFS